MVKQVKQNKPSQYKSFLSDSDKDSYNSHNHNKKPTKIAISEDNANSKAEEDVLSKSASSSDQDVDNPLFAAIQQMDSDKVQTLLDNGANPNAIDGNGNTPLTFLVLEDNGGNTESALLIMQKLIDSEANTNAIDGNGCTPLTSTVSEAYGQNAESALLFIQKLIVNGATPDTIDNNGNIPLTIAAFRKHERIVELLLDNKANPNAIDKKGNKPLMIAEMVDSEEIAELLLQKGATPDDIPLIRSARQGKLKMVQTLLDNKANPNAIDNNGNTALTHVLNKIENHSSSDVLKPLLKIFKLFLEYDAQINPETNEGAAAQDYFKKSFDYYLDCFPNSKFTIPSTSERNLTMITIGELYGEQLEKKQKQQEQLKEQEQQQQELLENQNINEDVAGHHHDGDNVNFIGN